MELQLDDRRALDGLRFHVLDAGDVEEVILVIVGEVTFHLRRVHAAVRLRDVNGGDAERRKNVARHFLERQPRGENHAEQKHEDRERSAQR